MGKAGAPCLSGGRLVSGGRGVGGGCGVLLGNVQGVFLRVGAVAGCSGHPYTQSMALGCGSPIGGLWSFNFSSSPAGIHTPSMMGTWSSAGV